MISSIYLWICEWVREYMATSMSICRYHLLIFFLFLVWMYKYVRVYVELYVCELCVSPVCVNCVCVTCVFMCVCVCKILWVWAWVYVCECMCACLCVDSDFHQHDNRLPINIAIYVSCTNGSWKSFANQIVFSFSMLSFKYFISLIFFDSQKQSFRITSSKRFQGYFRIRVIFKGDTIYYPTSFLFILLFSWQSVLPSFQMLQ